MKRLLLVRGGRHSFRAADNAAYKLLYILNTCRPFHVGDGKDLVRVRFDASSTDNVAQQYTGWNSKDAF